MSWLTRRWIFLLGLSLGIVVLVACQNEPLQANAGDDFTIRVGERPIFDGCASTGDIINYQWTIVTPSPNMPEDEGKIIREAAGTCSFTLEAMMGVDEVGRWVIELEVRDAADSWSTDQVVVDVVE